MVHSFPTRRSSYLLAEFGVVFLMFTIGLEFSLARLFHMRRLVFGLGGAQVLLTMVALGGVLIAFGMSWEPAVALAAALAVSSTAIVIRMRSEEHTSELQSLMRISYAVFFLK